MLYAKKRYKDVSDVMRDLTLMYSGAPKGLYG